MLKSWELAVDCGVVAGYTEMVVVVMMMMMMIMVVVMITRFLLQMS